MKFIHTADWQIGKLFGSVPDKADLLRQARLAAVKQVVALAEKEHADFVLAAGDLLENNRISPSAVEEMAAAVARCPVPVYLLPGNHDPLTPDSPYVYRSELFSGNAIVLRDEAPLSIAGGTLYPCPLRSKSGTQDPTQWIPAAGEGIRVGVAHGSVGTPTPDDFPIKPRPGLDYLALGHWHSCKQIDDRTWYSGTPEPTAFDEGDSGNALVVEIAAPGAPARVRKVPLARYTWRTVERELHDEAAVAELQAELDGLASAQLLVWLRLTGRLSQPLLDQLERLSGERFFHLRLDIDIGISNGEREYRHPLLRQMAETLAFGEDPAASRRALSRLAMFVKQCGFHNEEV